MKIDAINKNNICFKNIPQIRNCDAALLMLSGHETVNEFKRNYELAVKANSIDTNPVTAIGYKLYNTFRYIFKKESDTPKNFSMTA